MWITFSTPSLELMQMEHTNLEAALVEQTALKAADTQMAELLDLQLAIVGGGVGEISPY
jgi:hypothetical protein